VEKGQRKASPRFVVGGIVILLLLVVGLFLILFSASGSGAAKFKVTTVKVESVVPIPVSARSSASNGGGSIAEVEVTIRNMGGRAASASCVVSVRDRQAVVSTTVRTPAAVPPGSAANLSTTINVSGQLGASDTVPTASCVPTTPSSSTSIPPTAGHSGLPAGFPTQFQIPSSWQLLSATGVTDTAKGLPAGSRSFEVTFQSAESPASAFSSLTGSLRSRDWTLSDSLTSGATQSTGVQGFGYKGSVAVTQESTQPQGSRIAVTLEGS